MTEEFPPVEVPYELRVTGRALADLGVGIDLPRGDLNGIAKASTKKDLVEKFAELRAETPTGTEPPMRNVRRPDIFSLHGRDGVRACTWYDKANEVCWLLACVDEHDYATIETRAANNELLPDHEDLTILFVERENFDRLVAAGVEALVEQALSRPGYVARGTVGGILRLEVSVLAIVFDNDRLVDLFIVVRLPPLNPGTAKPDGWPGSALLERLAELATGLSAEDLDLSVPADVPHNGSLRTINPSAEIAIKVENLHIVET